MSIINATGRGGSMGGNVNIVQFGDMTPAQFAAACAGNYKVSKRPLSERIQDATPYSGLSTTKLGALVEYDNKAWRIIHRDRENNIVYLRLYYVPDNMYLAINSVNASVDVLKFNDTGITDKLQEYIDTFSNDALTHLIPMYTENTELRAYVPTASEWTYEFELNSRNTRYSKHYTPYSWIVRDVNRYQTVSCWTSSISRTSYNSVYYYTMQYIDNGGLVSLYNPTSTGPHMVCPFIAVLVNEIPDDAAGDIGVASIDGTLNTGENVRFDGRDWIVAGIKNNIAYLFESEYHNSLSMSRDYKYSVTVTSRHGITLPPTDTNNPYFTTNNSNGIYYAGRYYQLSMSYSLSDILITPKVLYRASTDGTGDISEYSYSASMYGNSWRMSPITHALLEYLGILELDETARRKILKLDAKPLYPYYDMSATQFVEGYWLPCEVLYEDNIYKCRYIDTNGDLQLYSATDTVYRGVRSFIEVDLTKLS